VGQKRLRPKAAVVPKRAAKRRRFVWPSGAPPGVPVTAAVAVVAGGGEVAGPSGVSAAPEVPPRKLTRYEAMWTDCDPALWEYVVV
jgi:hypothetical protein